MKLKAGFLKLLDHLRPASAAYSTCLLDFENRPLMGLGNEIYATQKSFNGSGRLQDLCIFRVEIYIVCQSVHHRKKYCYRKSTHNRIPQIYTKRDRSEYLIQKKRHLHAEIL